MALIAGARVGPYEILSPLGAGGMGEVYRARDTKLKRDVALKLLPESFANDPERLARFHHEAEILASLNHPNIAHIHGLEESGHLVALVMELVEGEDLAQRIARGAIPVDDALLIAKQVADALEAAREQGVIHRDLKPANIKVRPDGTVKVLDFGLAKLVPTSDVAPPVADSSQATLTIPATTRMGVIMGTAAYMSPEQARGKPLDKRTDIWAFGCVFYEMLSGRAAFAGETISDTIARILEREPDWQALPSSTPTQIRELLRRCLQKDQARRPQDITDARVEIEDARAARSRPRRRVGLITAAGWAALALTVMAGAWWYGSKPSPPVQHAPVSVVIADFLNNTNDPIFDRTLEPMLRIVLEGAGFVTAYDRNRVRTTFGLAPLQSVDEPTARRIAVQQGLGVVLAGAIAPSGAGFDISMRVSRASTGTTITEVSDHAAGKQDVLSVLTSLAASARGALGDETPRAEQLVEMKSVSTRSMDVVRHFSAAMESQSDGRYEDARQSLLKAVELDPTFGMVYQGLAVISRNQGSLQDAKTYIEQALRHLDDMSERERQYSRAFYYRLTGDYEQCAREYGDIAQNAADAVAHNQRALCLSKLRKLGDATNDMRRALQIVPDHLIFRGNLALYTAYAGDFLTAEREARAVQQPSDLAELAVAFSQVGQNLLLQASGTYLGLAQMSRRGASWSSSGLADLALYEGRFSDARRLLEEGIALDLKATSADRAGRKLTALAYAHLSAERPEEAVAAAERAIAISKATEVRLLAARIAIDAGMIDKAQEISTQLAADVAAEPQAFGKILEGKIAAQKGDAQRAIRTLIEANNVLDTWLGHFELGRAYLGAGAFAQADSEFDRCIKRRGEALSLFLDEEPTFAFLAPVYYYQGRAREGLRSDGFAESYRAYLRIREKASEDPMLPDVRRRAGL